MTPPFFSRFAKPALLCCGVFFFAFHAHSQMPGPGYEREVKAIEARKVTGVLDQDSVNLVDVVILFDPETYEETEKIVRTTLSWRDYLNYRLGVNNADELLNGQPKTITDPKTYEDLVIRWNAEATKIDTIR